LIKKAFGGLTFEIATNLAVSGPREFAVVRWGAAFTRRRIQQKTGVRPPGSWDCEAAQTPRSVSIDPD